MDQDNISAQSDSHSATDTTNVNANAPNIDLGALLAHIQSEIGTQIANVFSAGLAPAIPFSAGIPNNIAETSGKISPLWTPPPLTPSKMSPPRRKLTDYCLMRCRVSATHRKETARSLTRSRMRLSNCSPPSSPRTIRGLPSRKKLPTSSRQYGTNPLRKSALNCVWTSTKPLKIVPSTLRQWTQKSGGTKWCHSNGKMICIRKKSSTICWRHCCTWPSKVTKC